MVRIIRCFNGAKLKDVSRGLLCVNVNDFSLPLQAAAEANTFFFVELLSGFRDNFCQQLHNSVVGQQGTSFNCCREHIMQQFLTLLESYFFFRRF